ncbi:MAG: hypothetical protein QM621_04330 [Aeromicrobium sp.]|uniref:hypothetical protein n=1 Tax=Aeromicrobium sp. TaxID=1871063 RepID=UPI0039E6218C
MSPMMIGGARWLGVGVAVAGMLLAGVAAVRGWPVMVWAGFFLMVVGAMAPLTPVVRVEPYEVRVLRGLGSAPRRFPIAGPFDLRIDGADLWHVPTRTRIISLGVTLDQAAVEQLRAQLER